MMKATDKQNESKEIEIIEIEDDPTKDTKTAVGTVAYRLYSIL